MKHLILSVVSFIIISLLGLNNLNAQADTLLNFCSQHLPHPYISDGQQYKTLLNGDEIAEFNVTFYKGSTYRIVACSGLTDGNLLFSLWDKNRNLLFSNAEHRNTPYWDFKFTSTVDCFIEAQLDPNGPSSGFAIILIGFRQ